ncbi:hypothetical protein [Desulfonema ishimotonii]|uniref:hypothetical protein n=1 Tax=Desulfonema ishimotonii TaxID=45657 RepID=UPI000F55D4A8|nr:hypothetical protein [Desulfonema ishimotonii]
MTHPLITELAVENSGLDSYLKDVLNFDSGIKTEIEGVDEESKNAKKSILKWMRYGAEMEDEPMCRSSNHFHNPLKDDWGESGLTDTIFFVNLWCAKEQEYSSGNIRSNISWATGFTDPDTPDDETRERNQWDWESAKEYYYAYLIGNDQSPNQYLVSCFRALGQVLHMLQDVAVPAHVRNDFSKGHAETIPADIPKDKITDHWGNRFEAYVKKYSKRDNTEWFHAGSGISLTEISLTNFWDTQEYEATADSIESNQNQIGLAEYTNFNFISEGAMLAEQHEGEEEGEHYFPFPNKDRLDNDLTDYDSRPPVVNGQFSDKPIFTYSIGTTTSHGEKITNLIKPSYLTRCIKTYKDISEGREGYELYIKSFRLDRDCFKDQAKLLIPRAVGYSAGLLDYFFRGKLDITVNNDATLIDPIRQCVDHLELTITNTTPDEDMTEGRLVLVVKYRMAEDEPYQYITGNISENFSLTAEQTSDTISFEFDPYDFEQGIPLDAQEASIYIVYRGQLGTEEDGIAVGMSQELILPTQTPDISISLPDKGVYAISDNLVPDLANQATRQGFDKISLRIENTSSADILPDDNILNIIIRYRMPITAASELTDPFVSPSEDEPLVSAENFGIGASWGIGIIPAYGSLDFSGDKALDLSDNNIPIWATNLCLYVTWRSGDNTYWSARDISEATPVVVWNMSDRVCINGAYVTSGTEAAKNAVKNGDGILLADVFPDKMKEISIRFSPGDAPADADYSCGATCNSYYRAEPLGPGEYLRLFILTDDFDEITAPGSLAYNFSIDYLLEKTDDDDTFHGDTGTVRQSLNMSDLNVVRMQRGSPYYVNSWTSFSNTRGIIWHMLYRQYVKHGGTECLPENY